MPVTAVPKDRRGLAGELRLLVLTRRSAVKARTQASNQIKAFLVEAGDQLRDEAARPAQGPVRAGASEPLSPAWAAR